MARNSNQNRFVCRSMISVLFYGIERISLNTLENKTYFASTHESFAYTLKEKGTALIKIHMRSKISVLFYGIERISLNTHENETYFASHHEHINRREKRACVAHESGCASFALFHFAAALFCLFRFWLRVRVFGSGAGKITGAGGSAAWGRGTASIFVRLIGRAST